MSLKDVFNFPLLCEVYTIFSTWSNTFSVIFSVVSGSVTVLTDVTIGGQFKTKIDQTSHTMTYCRDFTQENQHFPTWPFFIFNAFFLFIPLPRWLTVIVGEEFPIDLRMLKSFRCLRPLKMVSKVPSKFSAISAHRDLAPASCRIKSRFLPRFQKNGNLDVESWIWDEKYLLMNTHSSSQPEHRV